MEGSSWNGRGFVLCRVPVGPLCRDGGRGPCSENGTCSPNIPAGLPPFYTPRPRQLEAHSDSDNLLQEERKRVVSQRVTRVVSMEEFGPSSYRPESDGRSRSPHWDWRDTS